MGVRISALPPGASGDGDDELPFVDDSASTTKKITFTVLKEWFQSLAGWIGKSNVDFDSGIWWEELGRTTLGSSSTSITLSGLTAKKYLRIIVSYSVTGGAGGLGMIFNNDTGNNYTYTRAISGAADASATSQAFLFLSENNTTNDPCLFVADIVNVQSLPKLLVGQYVGAGASGAGNASVKVESTGKWHNTANQINRIDAVIRSAPGSFDVGSEIIVLGHD